MEGKILLGVVLLVPDSNQKVDKFSTSQSATGRSFWDGGVQIIIVPTPLFFGYLRVNSRENSRKQRRGCFYIFSNIETSFFSCGLPHTHELRSLVKFM